jgi:pimeloyl-ACP methyl ester carboxylesterase
MHTIRVDDPRGPIDYQESGVGPTLVLVPGSCSTGAAWRPIMAALGKAFRCVTTSLLGYGGTAERRTMQDCSIDREAEAVEAVIRRTGAPVHLVGHSFGGLVSLAVALRGHVPLTSLVVAEAPALELLRAVGEHSHYSAFQQMTASYFTAFMAGNTEAIETMIDFYGGAGTYASWPQRVREYAVRTTAVNIMDWASAQGFATTPRALANITTPTLILTGTASHPAVRRANELLSQYLPQTELTILEGAAHFMILSHASEVARGIANHVRRSHLRTIAPRTNGAIGRMPHAEGDLSSD